MFLYKFHLHRDFFFFFLVILLHLYALWLMDFHFPFFIIFLIFCIFFFGWGSLCCCFDLFLSFRFSLFKFLSWGILRRLKLVFWGQFYCISYSIDWGWIYSDFLPYAMCVFPWVSWQITFHFRPMHSTAVSSAKSSWAVHFPFLTLGSR